MLENQTKFPTEFYDKKLKIFTVMHVTKNTETGHADKRPLDARNGNIMKWKKDPFFLTLDDARDWLNQLRKQNKDKHFEVGMLIQSPYTLLDLDNIADEVNDIKQNSHASDRILKITKLCVNPYVEYSQSGHGLHFIFKGRKTTKISHTDKYELYDNDRWLALTGNCLHMPEEIAELDQTQMQSLEQYLFKDELKKKAEMSQNTSKSTTTGNNLELDQIINKIKQSKEAEKFDALWNNQDGGNPSSGDQQLANILIWWVNHDVTKADQLFRQSARMRDKWDEVHSSDGQTYGQLTLQNADQTVSGGYTGKRQQVEADDIDVKSMDDLIKKLQAERQNWDLNHTDDKGNVARIADVDIINIIEDNVPLAILYAQEAEIPDAPLFYYNYDTGIYCDDSATFEKFILAIAPERTATKTRENIIDTLRKKPSQKIETHQLTTEKDQFHRYIALGNGVFDTQEKKLLKYSKDWYFVTKTATNYNPDASVEPTYNGWSMSHSIQQIAGGDKDKEKLIWQVCKAAVTGCWWLRKFAYFKDSGQGQTGKSTLEEALTGVVGEENTTQLRLSDMQDETKLIDGIHKSLIIGDDNDVNQTIKNFGYLNPLISGEPVRVRNYYEKSRISHFHSFIIQSGNGLPPFSGATEAFFKRMIVINFNTQHDASNPKDFAVKHDYIHRKEWQEWFLWYVLNKVDLDISLTNTKESQKIIDESHLESDTIGNFINNWLTTISSTKLPISWLYAFYSSACTSDSLQPLSKRIFTRKILENPKFSKDWKKVTNVRITPEEDFFYDDALKLQKMISSMKWGHHIQAFFPITRMSISQGDNSYREGKSFDTITKDDFVEVLKNFHGTSFVKK